MSSSLLTFILAALVTATTVTTIVLLRRRRKALPPQPTTKPLAPATSPSAETTESDQATQEPSEQQRYHQGLARTRGGFVAKLARLFRDAPSVSEELKEEIELVLFTADIGAATAQKLLDSVHASLKGQAIVNKEALWHVIRSEALRMIDLPAPPTNYNPPIQPYVLLMIGVNGVGKTTTLGKLAAMHRSEGRRVLLVAGDTFRAAASEQLEVWAKRVGCEIHQGEHTADPSSVIFDGIMRGKREGFDVVLCDTAGRLHTKKTLMDELAKVRRSCAKALALTPSPDLATNPAISPMQGPHDTFLVLDATIGQNALAQAEMFKETMDFSGLVLTKLDGTAKGGVVLGICDTLQVPVRFIGIGEGITDLRPFNAQLFCDALLNAREIA